MLGLAPLTLLRRGALAAVLLAAPSLAACSYTHHEGVLANGDSSQLYFSGTGVSSAADELLAVGYAATLTVERYGPTDVPCTGLGLHKNGVAGGDLHVQGGSLPDTDHCDGRPADAVSVISAACTDDTCSVTADTSNPRVVTLTVTGAHAGTGHLAVSLKSVGDGNTYEDSVAMRFSEPVRISLAAFPRDIPAMIGPVLPGVRITKPRAYVLDADGATLTIDDSALRATSDGDAYVDARQFSLFEADHAGHTTLRWSYPGVPDRSLDLEVVSPSEAHALFVYAPLPDTSTGTAGGAHYPDPADVTPVGEPDTGRITSIELEVYDFGTFPIRVKLTDGRFALATIDDPVLAPAALGSTGSTLEPAAFDLEAGKLTGQGTLTLRAAPGAIATLAVKVIPRPPR